MNFNEHYELEGSHAFLSPSNYHWINYDETKLVEVYRKMLATKKGTDLHELASRCIKLGIKLPRSRKSFDMYVNDAIGFRMTPELLLYYSENAFGTVDTISFRNNLLRIHDLKTGVTPTSMRQLEVYTALYCLEYDKKPNNIEIELRIYQADEVVINHPEHEQIQFIMNKIILFDKRIDMIKAEE